MRKFMPRAVGICLLLGMLFSLIPAQAATYSDVSKKHWAYAYIDYLSEKNVLAGDGNGRFRPDASVTRAEFIKMMVSTFGLQETKQTEYTNVPDWARKYIEAAAAQGFLLNYKSDANFSAGLTRQEAVALLMRYLGFEAEREFDGSKLPDLAEITESYRPYVLAAVSNGIVEGYEDGSFRPKKVLTRAEALRVLYQAAGSIYNVSATAAESGAGAENATVNASVTLTGITLSGNVYLTEGAAFVTLNNCTIAGMLYVRAGTYVNLARSKADKVVVLGDGAVFSLSNGAEIARLEAHGKTEAVINASCALTTAIFHEGAEDSALTGSGKLENFGVYCSDVRCELEPKEYYVSADCSALIGGVLYGPGSGRFESCGLGMAQAQTRGGMLCVQANALSDGTLYAALWMNDEAAYSGAQIRAQALQTLQVQSGGAVQLELACRYDPAHYTLGLVFVPAGQDTALAPLYSQQTITQTPSALGTKLPPVYKSSAPTAELCVGTGLLTLEFDQLLYYKADNGDLTPPDASQMIASLTAQDLSGLPAAAGEFTAILRTDDAKTKLLVCFADGIPAQTAYTLTLSDRLFTVYGSAPQTLAYTSGVSETASILQPEFVPERAHILRGTPLAIRIPDQMRAMRYTYTVNGQEPSLSMVVYGSAEISFDTLPANARVRISASALTDDGAELGRRARTEYVVNAAPLIVLGGVSYTGAENTAGFAGPVSVSALAPSGLEGTDYSVRLYIDGEEHPLAAIAERAGQRITAELYYKTEKIGESAVLVR